MKQALIGSPILLGLLLVLGLDRSSCIARGQTATRQETLYLDGTTKWCGGCKRDLLSDTEIIGGLIIKGRVKVNEEKIRVGEICPYCGVRWGGISSAPLPKSGADAESTNRTPGIPNEPKTFAVPKSTDPVALPARFVIRVPPKADVEIDGVKMKQDGAERSFRTPPLLAGNSYTYEVKASWKEDGKDIVVREKVRVSPGTALGLDFRPERGKGAALGPAQMRPAVLLFRVPAAAQVELEGAKTAQKGELRRFETQPLEMGSKYRYAVKATWKENGKDVVREQTVSFRPGEETTVDLRQPAAAADKK